MSADQNLEREGAATATAPVGHDHAPTTVEGTTDSGTALRRWSRLVPRPIRLLRRRPRTRAWRIGPSGLRRRPVRLAVVALVVMSVAADGALELTGHGLWWSRDNHGDWRTVFDGYGQISYQGTTILLEPASPAIAQETHAALTVSSRSYGDLAATVRLRTERQLRSGKPNPWEVGWVLWHYTSPQRFYAVTLKSTGWELSKQDPDYPGGQRFLASGTTPAFAVGQWHTVGIVQIGNRIEIAANGLPLVRFVDRADPYLNGRMGLYVEDAQARFTGVELMPVPSSTQKGAPSP